MDNLKYWVWLTVKTGMSSFKITNLLDRFGSVEAIYEADLYKDIEGIGDKEKTELSNKSFKQADRIISKIAELGARIVTLEDEEYPKPLRTIQSPPYVLYMKGQKFDWDNYLGIGVIGARECTEYGIVATHKLCTELAATGVTVISGMARGIDSVAAVAALKAGGKTIAVIGSGLDICYPPENDELMKAIEENGLVITEYPPSSQPLRTHFPERNRIISGLSRGILVTEAAKKSGTFITVGHAIENGRDIFAIPGGLFHEKSEGTNLLIKQGAFLTTSVTDIFEQYPDEASRLKRATGKRVKIKLPKQSEKPPKQKKKKEESQIIENLSDISIDDSRFLGLNNSERSTVECLLKGSQHVDEIARETGLGIQELNAVLPMLEMMGHIIKLPGNIYAIKA